MNLLDALLVLRDGELFDVGIGGVVIDMELELPFDGTAFVLLQSLEPFLGKSQFRVVAYPRLADAVDGRT